VNFSDERTCKNKKKPRNSCYGLNNDKCIYIAEYSAGIGDFVGYLVAYNTAKHKKPFVDSEFVKQLY
jgi:hypothetical protein